MEPVKDAARNVVAPPQPVEEEDDGCSFSGEPAMDELLSCSEERGDFYSERAAFQSCIEKRCGPRPPADLVKKLQAWNACVDDDTGVLVGAPKLEDEPGCDRTSFDDKACSLESTDLCLDAMVNDVHLWADCFRQIDAYNVCIEDRCGPRPADGQTKAWDVCAAVYTRVGEKGDGEAPARFPYSLMQLAKVVESDPALAKVLVEDYLAGAKGEKAASDEATKKKPRKYDFKNTQ